MPFPPFLLQDQGRGKTSLQKEKKKGEERERGKEGRLLGFPENIYAEENVFAAMSKCRSTCAN
jgi:hypothetical protein